LVRQKDRQKLNLLIRPRDEYGRPEFRRGLRRSRVVPGTVLSTIFDGAPEVDVTATTVTFWIQPFTGALGFVGLALSGLQTGRNLVDAVEVPSLRFFVGMQGHPELMTRRATPIRLSWPSCARSFGWNGPALQGFDRTG
jgi:CTP synthase